MKKILLVVTMCFIGCSSIVDKHTKIILNNGKYNIKEIKINNNKINTPKKITFNIDKSKIYGNAGCNSYFADFSMGVDNITINVSGSTKMYCIEYSEFENIYLQNLNGNFKISGNNKEINLNSNNMQIILTR